MSGVNKVILLGRLGADPEVKTFDNGTLCNLRVATDSKWTDKATGEQKDATEWHNVVLRGRQAEIAGEYLKKGSQVYIEGRIRTRKWQDKEGTDRFTTEVQGNVMQLVGSAPQERQREEPAAAKKPAPKRPGVRKVATEEDDIPF